MRFYSQVYSPLRLHAEPAWRMATTRHLLTLKYVLKRSPHNPSPTCPLIGKERMTP